MLMLYENPVALDRERHRNLRLQRQVPEFHFARKTNSVPLAGVEFGQAAGHYPIIFAGIDGNRLFPAALLGLQDEQNLFVDTQGMWHASYIPAYVRRYPFVLASPDGEQADNYTVCIDEAFEGLTEDGHGEDLFEASGEPAPFLQRAMTFLTDYQQNLRATEQFAARLHELGLLVERRIDVVSAGGQSLNLTGVHVVDEQKLVSLDDGTALELFRAGYLGWIYAHLVSLNRVQHLAERFSELHESAAASDTAEAAESVAESALVDVETAEPSQASGASEPADEETSPDSP